MSTAFENTRSATPAPERDRTGEQAENSARATRPAVQILEGGNGAAALERVTRAVAAALEQRERSHNPQPLFVVPEHTDIQAAYAELSHLNIAPNTGILMRTSGSTTGQGKIVALPWESLLCSGQATHDFLGGAGTWINTLPLHHIAGFQTVVRSLAAGFTPVYAPIRSRSDDAIPPIWTQLHDLKRSGQRFYLSLVPTQLLRVLDDAQMLAALLRVVDAIVVGGAASSHSLLKRAHSAGLNVVTSYGMTETCGGCVYNGVAIGDTSVSIDDDGRISLTGSVVGLGYLSEHGALAESNSVRTHETADFGCWKEGKLQVLGRIDDAITTGGLTVIPQVIEDAIYDTAGVEAVVFGIPDVTWGECSVAVLKTHFPHDDLRRALSERLERGWVPKHMVDLADVLSAAHSDSSQSSQHPSPNPLSPSPSPLHNSPALRNTSPSRQPQSLASASTWPLTGSGKIDRRLIRHAAIRYLSDQGSQQKR
ncbi:O-succinylbenzoic acid--CoA ligase [Arcanobacterium pluranimalium]|uniref:AMP-binding protein n=1 Tax=Arcanobacterium pluranimalium TaxID=108028 RepID=UPI00195EC2BF|nr:AMP-binding protein [Arcanobacterium pluranimalium]MBM7825903.1 O-succinylbenzoic acid--CoA ligase [Arcanobacterium pluranimalium]